MRPLAAGSLGAVRLGPARDLLFVRQILPAQRPAFSPDGKKIAVVWPAAQGPNRDMALDLFPTGGGKSERATQGDLRGSPRFLSKAELVVDGADRICVVTL